MRTIDGYMYDAMSPQWLKKMIRDGEPQWQNFDDEELMRWLYTQLGKKFSFDRKYRYAVTDEEKAEIESASSYGDTSQRIFRSESVICIDIENTYKMLLKDLFGIEARVVVDGSGPHVYVQAITSERKNYRLDLQQDLYNIKAGRRTEYFAAQDMYDGRRFDTMDSKRLEEIDRKIGYIDDKYMNDEMNKYNEAINNSKTEKEKVEKVFILLATKFSENTKSMKYCERTDLYKSILKEKIPDNHLAHRTFRSKGELFSCFILPDENEEGNEHYYLYSKQRRLYEEVDKERFLELDADNNKEIERLTEKYKPKKTAPNFDDNDDGLR